MEPVADSLVERIKAGDKKAENTLVETYWRTLYFILYKRSNDPDLAADITQDTFVVVLRKARAGEIENPDAISAFVRQVGINLLNASYQQKNRRKTDTDEDHLLTVADAQPSIFRELSADQLFQLVKQVITELPTERDRDLLYRVFIYGEAKQQICDALDLTPAHFDRVLHRARARLKQLLTMKYGEHIHYTFKDHSSAIAILLLAGLLTAGSSNQNDKNFTTQVGEKTHSDDSIHIIVREGPKFQLET